MPGNFQVICGSMLNLNWNPWLPTVLEIYCDRLKLVITGHFLFYSQKSWSYDVCFLRYGARQTLFFIIMGLFLHFYPAIDPEKLKYRKNVRSEVWNEDCMMYGSWDIKDDGQSFLSFYGHFLPFDLHNTLKNQNFEKMKIKKKHTPGHIIILHLCPTNDNLIMHGLWDMEHNRHVLSFWTIFCPITPITTQKMKILK